MLNLDFIKFLNSEIYTLLYKFIDLISSNKKSILTLILPTPKVINLCHQYRARPACTDVQSDHALYCWLTNCQSFILISLNMIMDSAKNVGIIISFKKFGMVRVNINIAMMSIWFVRIYMCIITYNNILYKKITLFILLNLLHCLNFLKGFQFF